MTEKTIEQLLEEQNKLLAEQNKLLRQSNATAAAISGSQGMEEIRARARRNTPWWAGYPTWAK